MRKDINRYESIAASLYHIVYPRLNFYTLNKDTQAYEGFIELAKMFTAKHTENE